MNPVKNKVIDCILFCGEVDILKLRLNETMNLFDEHIIVEAKFTFTNKERELVFPKIIDTAVFKRFKNKIKYIPVDEYPSHLTDAWQREKWLRNMLATVLKTGNYSPDDIAIIADCDEIPNVKTVKEYLDTNEVSGLVRMNMTMHYYHIKWVKKFKWNFPILIRIKDIGEDIDKDRKDAMYNPPGPVINDAGWHLDYFISASDISTKLKSFAHTEYSGDYFTNVERIQRCINTGKDLFDRSDIQDQILNTSTERPRFISMVKDYSERTLFSS